MGARAILPQTQHGGHLMLAALARVENPRGQDVHDGAAAGRRQRQTHIPRQNPQPPALAHLSLSGGDEKDAPRHRQGRQSIGGVEGDDLAFQTDRRVPRVSA